MPFNKFAFTPDEEIVQVRPSFVPQRQRHFSPGLFPVRGWGLFHSFHSCAVPPLTEIHPTAIILRQDRGRKAVSTNFRLRP